MGTGRCFFGLSSMRARLHAATGRELSGRPVCMLRMACSAGKVESAGSRPPVTSCCGTSQSACPPSSATETRPPTPPPHPPTPCCPDKCKRPSLRHPPNPLAAALAGAQSQAAVRAAAAARPALPAARLGPAEGRVHPRYRPGKVSPQAKQRAGPCHASWPLLPGGVGLQGPDRTLSTPCVHGCACADGHGGHAAGMPASQLWAGCAARLSRSLPGLRCAAARP